MSNIKSKDTFKEARTYELGLKKEMVKKSKPRDGPDVGLIRDFL